MKHTIDESFSQVHVLKLVDLDGDGQPELLAGKRYRGHNGNDPGSYDPLVIYYYKIDPGNSEFTRYPISVNGTAGAGTQFHHGRPGWRRRSGYCDRGKNRRPLFRKFEGEQGAEGPAREKQLLLDKNWPFPGEGSQVEWQRGKRQ